MRSAYDLAMTITSRCSGMFDRHSLGDQEYQFFDMFESSIGLINNQESQLFDRFNRASRRVAKWLQRQRLPGGRPTRSASPSLGSESDVDGGGDQDSDYVFPDALLEIDVETTLQAEIKDILDELNIIATIIDLQMVNLGEFEASVTDELRSGGSRRATDAAVNEVRRRSREQRRLLEVHRKDVERMDRQAEGIYTSLTHLLDLKQKHSNALEARFARVQTVIATRQGQAIIVFTTVTIIFLPMSFVAAFFAINFHDWGDEQLTIAYVSKYLFGIGLGISIPLIAMAFSVSAILDSLRSARINVGRWFHRRKQQKDPFFSFFSSSAAAGADTGDRDELYPDDLLEKQSRITADTARVRPHRSSLADTAHTSGGNNRGLGSVSSRGPPQLRVPEWAPRASAGSRGSGSAISWARPSFDDRGRPRVSYDLEMGRGERGRWTGERR